MAALMRIGGWGLVRDSLGVVTTQKSADSFTGDNVQFIPTTDAFVGDDEFVRDAAGAGVYKGTLAVGGDPFNVTDYCRGVVATDDVYIYSAGVQDFQIVFQSI